ncbi:MAG TPA: cellulase family glycosylhydrolase [Lacunisphaera sp.]
MKLPPCQRFLGLGLLVLILGLAPATAAPSTAPVNPSGFVIHRGTNLSHWLSQDFGWQPRQQWITENDFRFIARAGFDHVRLPIDEKEMWRDDGTPNEDAFALMLRAIGWARANRLRVIVDLHTVRSHHFNAANEGGHNTLFTDPRAQETFFGLWRQLSARLHDQPVDAVAYEIMNEPSADNHEDWNRLVAGAHRVIRQLEPERVLIIGSNRWQGPYAMPFLKVPAGDPNIILSVHTYSPFLFTHYTADWAPTKTYTGAVHYPGPVVTAEDFATLQKLNHGDMTDYIMGVRDNWGPERLAQEFEPAVRRAHELGLQLYCGEFGCLPTGPRPGRLAYYRDIVGVMEKNGMAWANWEYKGDFGLLEWHGAQVGTGAPDTEVLDALLAGLKK